MRRVIILGSTGSIGEQALDVGGRSADPQVVGLAALTDFAGVVEQAQKFGVERIALADDTAAVRAAEAWTGGTVLEGPSGLVELIVDTDCDLVLNAVVGSAGLGPTVAALGE